MRVLTLTLALLFVTIGAAQAATYYVATTGYDYSSCGTIGSPCLTIEYAYENKVSAGDTILVKPGTYRGGGRHPYYGRVRLNKRGTAEYPITIRSETYHGAILDGGANATYPFYFYFEGSGGSGLASYNIVDGFVITNTYKHGIVMWGDNNQVINNEIHHVGRNYQGVGDSGAGIFEDQESNGNHYEGNYIHDNPGTGLYLLGDNTTVLNNLFVHNGTVSPGHFGIQIRGRGTVTNMKVYNNTFAFNMRSGIVMWQDMNGVDIVNNIFYENAQAAIALWAATGRGVTIENNISYGNPNGDITAEGGTTLNYTSAAWNHNDPRFVDATAEDFDLESGSPAIDAGLTLSEVTTDIDGIARPQGAAIDIGAFELFSYSGGGTANLSSGGTANLALNKHAVASSSENASYPAAKAFDGSATTRWSSAFSDLQWIYVDLGANYTVSGVKLVWELASARAFKIQASTNAVAWTDIYSTTTGSGGSQTLTVPPTTARYIRMYGTARATSWGYSLWAMEVYGQ